MAMTSIKSHVKTHFSPAPLLETWILIALARGHKLRACDGCGGLFIVRRPWQRSCSPACRTRRWRARVTHCSEKQGAAETPVKELKSTGERNDHA
jgi:hypothetical protein